MALPPALRATEKALFKTQASVQRFAKGAWTAAGACDLAVVQDQASNEFRCLVSAKGVPVSNHLVHPVTVVHAPAPMIRAFWVQDWLSGTYEEACLEVTFADKSLVAVFDSSYALAQKEMAQLHASTKSEWGAGAKPAPSAATASAPQPTKPSAALVPPVPAPVAVATAKAGDETDEEDEEDEEEDEEEEEEEEEEYEPTTPPPNVASKPVGGADAWKTIAPGTWKCVVCSLNNKPGTTKCAACEEPKPATAATSSSARWNCPACTASNDAANTVCSECDADRPAAVQAPAAHVATPAPSAFNFAAALAATNPASAASSTTKPAEAPKFSFAGSAAPPTPPGAPSAPVFSFAKPPFPPASAAPPVFAKDNGAPAFSFAVPSSATAAPSAAKPVVSFGISSPAPPSSGAAFSFAPAAGSAAAGAPAAAAGSKDKGGAAPPSLNFSAFANVLPSVSDNPAAPTAFTANGNVSAVSTPVKSAQFAASTPNPPNFNLLGAAVSPSPTVAPPSLSTPLASAPPSSQKPTGASSSSAVQPPLSPKSRIERFYRQHNPTKMDTIPGLLEKYHGREEQLYAKLMDKYKVDVFDDAFPSKSPQKPATATPAVVSHGATTPSLTPAGPPKFGQTTLLSGGRPEDLRPQARPLNAAEEASFKNVTGGFAAHAQSSGGFGAVAAQGKSAFA